MSCRIHVLCLILPPLLTFQLFIYYFFFFSSPYLLHWLDQTFFFHFLLSSILTVPTQPLRIYTSFSSFQEKKKILIVLFFVLPIMIVRARKWSFSPLSTMDYNPTSPAHYICKSIHNRYCKKNVILTHQKSTLLFYHIILQHPI